MRFVFHLNANICHLKLVLNKALSISKKKNDIILYYMQHVVMLLKYT